jgi:hypothetical protein
MVMIRMAAMTETNPIQPRIEILFNVWIEASAKVPTMATTTQATVQVAWVVMALKAIEIATKPDPERKIMNRGYATEKSSRPHLPAKTYPTPSIL